MKARDLVGSFKVIIPVLLSLFTGACAPGGGYNAGNPQSLEYHLTILLDEILRPPSENQQALCPENYVRVPANSTQGIMSAFCVAKYEMKCAADDTGQGCSGLPLSQSAHSPWVQTTQAQAGDFCKDLGSDYHLMTNSEWMALAHDIAAQGANWSGGSKGSGTLARGWTGNGLVNNGPAPSTDSNCLYNTGVDGCASLGTFLYRRTNTLSNGEEIWDLAGNVGEWIDWVVVTDDKAHVSGAGVENSFREFKDLTVRTEEGKPMETLTWSPLDKNYSTTQGAGSYYAGTHSASGWAKRGGNWEALENGGIYALTLSNKETDTEVKTGFRCALSLE